MSNINLIIYEALFRARGIAQKLRPSVIAYKLTHNNILPARHVVSNSSKENKLFNKRLFDSNLNPEWLQRLYNSSHIPADFDISGGFDSSNVAFISFKTEITPQLKVLLQEISNIPDTYVDVNTTDFNKPLITIAGNVWYRRGEFNMRWENWFDSVTSILEDKGNDY